MSPYNVVPKAHPADTPCDFQCEGQHEYNLYLDAMAFVTTDSAANNISACKKLKVARINCFGHILYNALTTAMSAQNEVTKLLKASCKIVSVFSYLISYCA